MTIRVVVERIEDGQRQAAIVSHPTNSYAAGVQALDSCWAAFGKPDHFGYDFRIVETEMWGTSGPTAVPNLDPLLWRLGSNG